MREAWPSVRVGRLDFDLLAREGRPIGDFRPYRRQFGQADAGIGQKLHHVAPLAVGLDRQTGADRLGRGQLQRMSTGANLVQDRGLGGEGSGALRTD